MIDHSKGSIIQEKKRNQLKASLSGQILLVSLNKHKTKFEVSDFVKVSKKQRSNVVEVLVKNIYQYNLVGICIQHKKDPWDLNTSFLLRNVLSHLL